MGGDTAQVNLAGNPTVILMSGLQGSGKTTMSGKLAKKLKSEKAKRPLLVAGDVYRPAAIEQLKVLGLGKLLGHFIIDIGVKQRATHIFKCLGNIYLCDTALAA